VQCLWVETVLEPSCPGLIAAEPVTRPQGGKKLVPRVIVVLYDGAGLLPTPGPKDLDGWKCTPDYLFHRPNDPLDGFPVLSSGIAISEAIMCLWSFPEAP